jgi:hypothetical protein
MEDLRSRAFRVYLQHALASALTVESEVNQRKQHIDEQSVKAVTLWVRYCRNAQTISGVIGIVIVDRGESMVLHWIRYFCSFGQKEKDSNYHRGLKFEKSATCYCKALVRQFSGDVGSAALWSYAGMVYDQADATKLSDPRMYERQYSSDLSKWKGRAVEYGLRANDCNPLHHHAEISALRAEIVLKYHTKIAHTEVVLALCAHCKGLADSYIAATGRDHSAAKSAEYLIQALKYTENALESDKPGEEELQSLWKLCAKYMRAAAADAGTTGDDSFAWECACNSLALLARNLAPAVRILADMLTANPVVSDCTEMKGRLSAVFQQIYECPLVRDPTGVAVRHFGTRAIQGTIEAISFALQRVAAGSMQEDITMQRFLAAADKVNVDQSPAHPHIKQCWLHAAEQMRLAVATTMVSENKQHQRRSRVFTNLAHGPLATAAEYFVKADLAVSPQAKDLWRQAAQLTLETTIPYVQQSRLRDPFTEYATCADEMSMQRAHHLTEAARCCEHVHASEGTFQELRNAELQLRLALLERDAAVPPDNLGCWSCCMPLLDWCAQRPRTAACMMSLPGVPSVSAAAQSETKHDPDGRVARAAWLCRTLARVVKIYAALGIPGPHILTSDRIVGSLTAFQRQLIEGAVTLPDQSYSIHLDAAVDALEESQRLVEQSGREPSTEWVQEAARKAAEQFKRSAEYIAVGAARKYIEPCSSEVDTYLEKGERARQAGRWYAAAAQAAAHAAQLELWDVWSAYTMAATFTAERGIDTRGTDVTGGTNERANMPLLRSDAVRAGERFARAAEVLLAGDRELYEMWLKAAEATAYHIDKNPTGSRGQLDWEGHPELLARVAQEHQDGVSVEKLRGDGSVGGTDGRRGIHEGNQVNVVCSTCVVM